MRLLTADEKRLNTALMNKKPVRDVSRDPGAARGELTRRDFVHGSTAALAVAGGGAVLSACGGGADSSAGGSGLTELTFLAILPPTSLTFAAELLADAGGYFADEGLDVTFQSTRGSAQAIQLVLSGSALLTRVGQIEAVGHAANRDAPLMNVSTVIKGSTIRFVSSENAPLRTPEDFVGRTIGIPSEGGSTETTLDLVLSTAGIDPASVERQVVGLSPGVFNLVEQGRLAGYAVSIDTAKILERQRSGVEVLRPGEFIASGAQLYMVWRDGLAENEPLIRRYLNAIYGAVTAMVEDEDEGFEQTLHTLRTKYSFGTLQDTAVAQESLSEYVRTWTSDGRDNLMRTMPETWQRGYEELVQAGQAEGGKDPSEWFTNELVPAG